MRRPPGAPDPAASDLGILVRDHDWQVTALGPADRWPVSLRTAVGLVLGCPTPMQVWWGNGLTVAAYNDAFLPFVRARHPGMLGLQAQDAWPEIWNSVRAGAFSILGGGPGRSYSLERTTLSLSPIPDENGLPGGILVTAPPASGAEETSAALVEANNAKDEFLAMLGHELRNPLAPITTALHLLSLRSSADGARERAIIERQVKHLTRLVDDLLDVSRITKGKIQLELHDLEIEGVIAKAIEMAGPAIELRRQVLVLDLSAHGATVRGDPMRLAQVFANLLTNAAKYTNPEGRIEITSRLVGVDVQISVRDNGMGIAPEVLPHLFEPFSQERQALDRTQGGLGLGLAIVRGLVSAHGGGVSASSLGRHRGSVFTVTLPVSESTPENESPTEPSAGIVSPPVSATRLLVVDDNRDAAMLLSELFRLQGHDVRVAFDGFDALRIARSFYPQIVFLDLGLPVVDGYEICRKIRSDTSLVATRVVAITGYGNPDARRRTEESGFDAHLVKPVSAAQLEELIASFAALLST